MLTLKVFLQDLGMGDSRSFGRFSDLKASQILLQQSRSLFVFKLYVVFMIILHEIS